VNRGELDKAVAFLEDGDWQAAHEIVQKDEGNPLSDWAHGIVHILEGDLPNARYWYGQAKRAFPEPAAAEPELRALRKALTASG
jgi:hypothetical protein